MDDAGRQLEAETAMAYTRLQDQQRQSRINYLQASRQLQHFLDNVPSVENGVHLGELGPRYKGNLALLEANVERLKAATRQQVPHDAHHSLDFLLEHAFGSPEYSDFQIRCQDATWPVHRYIISKRSRYFAMACELDMRERHEGFIDLVEENPDVVHRVLKYIYTGKIALGRDANDIVDEQAAVAVDVQSTSDTAYYPDMEGKTLEEIAPYHSGEDDSGDEESSGSWINEDDEGSLGDERDDLDEPEATGQQGQASLTDGQDEAEVDDDIDMTMYESATEDQIEDDASTDGSSSAESDAIKFESNSIQTPTDDDLQSPETQRLLQMIHLYAAAHRFQVYGMKEEIASMFEEDFAWPYFCKYPRIAMELVREVYSTTPNVDRGLRDTALDLIKRESADLVVHLKEELTALFEFVPQLAFDQFQDSMMESKGPEVDEEL